MIKKLLRFVLMTFVIGSISFTQVSCSSEDEPTPTEDNKDDDNTGSNDDTSNAPDISDNSKTEGQSIKKDEDPKTKKVKGTTDVNGTSVENPATATADLDADALNKLHLLTGTNGTSGQNGGRISEELGLYGWFIDEINGVNVIGTPEGDTYIYYFYEDGYYLEYDIVNDDWNWGYFYINDDMTEIVFDIEVDDNGNLDLTNASTWDVVEINDSTLKIDDGTDEVVLNSYYLGDFDEEEWTTAELNTELVDRFWYFAYVYVNGEFQNDFFERDPYLTGTGTDTLNILSFFDDGTFWDDEYIRVFNADVEDTAAADYITLVDGEWSMDADGNMTLTWLDDLGDPDFSAEFYLNYVTADEMDMSTYMDWDGDGFDDEVEFIFLTEEAYEDEFYFLFDLLL